MERVKVLFLILTIPILGGCMIPGTKYDPFDPYAFGVRWYDRGGADLRSKPKPPKVRLRAAGGPPPGRVARVERWMVRIALRPGHGRNFELKRRPWRTPNDGTPRPGETSDALMMRCRPWACPSARTVTRKSCPTGPAPTVATTRAARSSHRRRSSAGSPLDRRAAPAGSVSRQAEIRHGSAEKRRSPRPGRARSPWVMMRHPIRRVRVRADGRTRARAHSRRR